MSRQVKNRTGTACTARHIFYTYRKKCKKAKLKHLEYGRYRQFILDYHAEIIRECTEEKFEYKAPCRLGTFKIVKKKLVFVINEKTGGIDQKYTMIDWVKTKTLWEKNPAVIGKRYIYFTNPHTNGYYFKWEWSRNIAQFRNRDYYIFLPLYTNRKKLYNKIMEDPKSYDAYMGTPSVKSRFFNGQ